MAKAVKVIDLECFPNFFSQVSFDIHAKDVIEHVVHPARNEFPQMVQYFEDCIGTTAFIGYNIHEYDYPFIHYILKNKKRLLGLTIDELVADLYKKGQSIIKDERPSIAHWHKKINYLDLFRVHHFNNAAKRTSLKALQIAMRWPKVQDLPFEYFQEIDSSQIDSVQSYCLNDVMSTYQFFLESAEEMKFRSRISKEYGIDATNLPDVKIGEEILVIENAKALGLSVGELKKMRTKRGMIPLKDLILDYVKFNSKEFNGALDFFKNTIVDADETKGSADYSVLYGGMNYDFGLGGIHGTCGNGVFKSDDEGDLILVDVSSYYPNLAIRNKFYPKHLSETFCNVGEALYDKRMKAKAEGDNQMVGAIKLALNGALFGKSNDQYSAMYDPAFMLSITINGQLLLCMLSEQIVDAGIETIQINTDGILVKCTKEQRKTLDELCDAWQELTSLSLDYDLFETVVQRDVNNYIGKFTNGKIKYKGTFDIHKAWNKDHSMRVVSQAVSDYFLKGTPVRETIESCEEIYDFCISQKVGKQFTSEHHYIVDGELRVDKIQRINRFFVTNSGGALVKRKTATGASNRLVAGNQVKLFNDYYHDTMDEYNVNYNFYVSEANKIIHAVANNQMSLF